MADKKKKNRGEFLYSNEDVEFHGSKKELYEHIRKVRDCRDSELIRKLQDTSLTESANEADKNNKNQNL